MAADQAGEDRGRRQQAELGIAEPTTWEELLVAAQTLQDAGYIPFANAAGDSWTIATLLLQNWIPSVIGGIDGRMAYVNGEKCLNDANWVQVFKQAQDMVPFLPEGWEALTYYDSQQLFLQGVLDYTPTAAALAVLPAAILLSSMIPGMLIFLLREESHRLRTVLNMTGALVKLGLVIWMIVSQLLMLGSLAIWRVPGMPLWLSRERSSSPATSSLPRFWV